MQFEIHPAADIFPMMATAAFNELKEDIRQHGQRDYIVLFEGRVLDGRNRLKACQELGIEPDVGELEECKDPVAFVVSKNLHRRHLTESQRSTVAARVANMAVGKPSSNSANLQNIGAVSQSEAASLLSVSTRSVAAAKKVLEKGSPELVAAVDAGDVAVSLAAKYVDAVPSKKEQAADVKKGPAAIREAVRDAKPAPAKPPKAKPQPEPAGSPAGPPMFKQFLELWERCDETAQAAIRAFVLNEK